MAKARQPKKSDESKPWSATISQKQLSQYPGEMAARKLAVKNIEKADLEQRKAHQAIKGDHTLY